MHPRFVDSSKSPAGRSMPSHGLSLGDKSTKIDENLRKSTKIDENRRESTSKLRKSTNKLRKITKIDDKIMNIDENLRKSTKKLRKSKPKVPLCSIFIPDSKFRAPNPWKNLKILKKLKKLLSGFLIHATRSMLWPRCHSWAGVDIYSPSHSSLWT